MELMEQERYSRMPLNQSNRMVSERIFDLITLLQLRRGEEWENPPNLPNTHSILSLSQFFHSCRHLTATFHHNCPICDQKRQSRKKMKMNKSRKSPPDSHLHSSFSSFDLPQANPTLEESIN
jgi:hypothetical protein